MREFLVLISINTVLICIIFSLVRNAYVAEWSKALDLRSIVLLYAQVRTLSYANITIIIKFLFYIVMKNVFLLSYANITTAMKFLFYI